MRAFFEKKEKNKVYAARLSGFDMPLHLHPQLELFFMFSGKMLTTVRDQQCVLTGGNMAVIFPNEIHSYTSLTSDVSCALFHCDLSFTGGYMDTLLLNHPTNPFLEGDKIHPNILYAIEEMITEQKTKEQSAVYAPLIQLALARILPLLTLQHNKSSDYPELIYQISNYISEHFMETLTLGTLAKEIGTSRYHLSHLFSEKMGQNFLSYLSDIRLSYACKLLTETDLSVTNIVEKAGFESQSTFYRVFKSRFGMTPLKYRQIFNN